MLLGRSFTSVAALARALFSTIEPPPRFGGRTKARGGGGTRTGPESIWLNLASGVDGSAMERVGGMMNGPCYLLVGLNLKGRSCGVKGAHGVVM